MLWDAQRSRKCIALTPTPDVIPNQKGPDMTHLFVPIGLNLYECKAVVRSIVENSARYPVCSAVACPIQLQLLKPFVCPQYVHLHSVAGLSWHKT